MKKAKIVIAVLIAGLLISGLLLVLNGVEAKKAWKIEDDLEEELEELTEEEELSVIVMLKEKAKDFKEFEEEGAKVSRNYKIIPGFSAKVSKAGVKNIAKLSSVGKIYLNKPVRALLDESVPMIKADKVWAKGITGAGVKVCMVDTGVDYNHPALQGKVIAQIDTINGDLDAMDDNGHGTWTAGAVASNDATYKGVAPGASLLVAKVLDAGGGGTYDSVIAGIDWCVGEGADVVSLSLGGGTYAGTCDEDALAIAVNNAVAQGVVASVAAGNEGIDGIAIPACASQAIAVGAVDKSGYVSWWSSEGPEMDILAPGVEITSLYPGKGYAYGDGTSIACPHISGVAALMLETNSAATVSEVKEAMYTTAFPAPGCYECRFIWRGRCYSPKITECDAGDVGAGIVDAYEAYLAIQPTGPACIIDADCDDGNPCTTDVCLNPDTPDAYCQNTAKADGTTCDDGQFCTANDVCTAGVCAGATRDCSDGLGCTVDSCDEVNDACVNTPVADNTACADGVCCAGGCQVGLTECPTALMCWSGSNQYLYRNRSQLKKFCKCAQGQYGYEAYSRKRQRVTAYRYVDSGDNEDWEVVAISTRYPVYRVECPDENQYYTNQDYYYGQ